MGGAAVSGRRKGTVGCKSMNEKYLRKKRESITPGRLWKYAVWFLVAVYYTLADVISFASGGSKYAKYLLLLALIAALCIYAVRNRGDIAFAPTGFHLYLAVLTAYAFLSAAWAFSGQLAMDKGVDLLEITLSTFAICLFFQDEKSMDALYAVIMWIGYFVVIYTVMIYGVDFLIARFEKGKRVTNDYLNANVLGMRAAYAIFINIYFIMKRGVRLTDLMIPAAFVLLAASGSRKAVIMLPLCVGMLFFLKCIDPRDPAKTLFRWLLLLAAFGLTAVLVLRLPMFSIVHRRLEGMIAGFRGSGAADSSAAMRFRMIELGKRLFLENPIGGVGFSNPRVFAGAELKFYTYLHNNYIEILAGGGVLGFIVYYSIYFYCICTLLRYRDFQDLEFDLALTFLTVYLILDYGHVSYESKINYLFILMFYSASRRMKSKGRPGREAAAKKPVYLKE